MTAAARNRAGKIAAAFAVVVGLVTAQRFGVFEQVRDPAQLTRSLLALGGWGYLAFVVAYAALQPFGIPGTVFVLAAALVWPWPIAFALSMVGTMAASCVGFSFARFVGRDWVTRVIPARFRRYNDRLERRAFTTVVVLRFIFWMPPLLHAFFGVSKVRFWTHFWGSFVGYLVPLFVVSFFGPRAFDWLRQAPPSVWVATGAAVIVIVLVAWRFRRHDAGDDAGITETPGPRAPP
ncbi:MAG: putative rane protein [Labilithrix sp.]|nr:putative rane protein [Labilithrix sp.]